jgi:hypothetical protein
VGDDDRIDVDVACLNVDALNATLISDVGFNCKVYRSVGTLRRRSASTNLDLVVKCHRFPCSPAKVRAYRRDHTRLHQALGDIVPKALFVATRIDGADSCVVLAQGREPWFDLANPAHEEEVRPLFKRLRRARAQLARFVEAARAWEREGRLVDLYGRDNLVLDRNREVTYLDSFGVFFHTDLVHAIGGVDEETEARMRLSRRRLDYVASLL